MEIIYDLGNYGWATASVITQEKTVRMTVSYLRDSLEELVEAALSLSEGETGAVVVFMDEPGEHHLIFEKGEEDQLHAEIRKFADWASWGMHPASDYQLSVRFETSVTEFRENVLLVLEQLLETYGESGYKERWTEHDFPIAEYKRLRAKT